MLCASFKGEEYLKPPYFVSFKLDGVRCILKDGVAYSRKLLPFPNLALQEKAKELYAAGLNNLDGELILGDTLAKSVFSSTTSCVTSINGEIHGLRYYVFDIVTQAPFNERIEMMKDISHPFITVIDQYFYEDIESLLQLEADYISKGGEGLICKSPDSPYKFGRSTLKENYAVKLKRFSDSEAKILEVLPLYSNNNSAEKDDLGYTKRSTKQAGLIKQETMGALLVEDAYSNIQFSIGSGFTAETRKYVWDNKDAYIGKHIKYKYYPVGIKEKPRFPTFLSFVDMNFK